MTGTARDRVFDFVRDTIEATGYPPNLDLIARTFRFSRCRASVLLTALVDEGRLKRRGVGTHHLSISGRVDLTGVGTEALRAELRRRERDPSANRQPQELAA